MQKLTKRDLILDAMQELMNTETAQSISVSDIAKKAGIGKGSVYYYFHSKNDIIEAVIERSYSSAIEESKKLVCSSDIEPFTKMEIIYRACTDASLILKRQVEYGSFTEIQESALVHQKFIHILIKNFKPILADIFRQGSRDGMISCENPEEVAEIVLIVLTFKLDNYIFPSSKENIQKTLSVFSQMQATSMGIEWEKLKFLTQ